MLWSDGPGSTVCKRTREAAASQTPERLVLMLESWSDVTTWARKQFVLVGDNDKHVAMQFEYDGGRSQTAGLVLHTFADDEWVTVLSALGAVGEVDLGKVSDYLQHAPLGGVIISGNLVYLRHSILLPTDEQPLREALRYLPMVADKVEELSSSADRY